ncbi:hypothetical protein RB195_026508 [Necator americanus]|uniref:Uncharacterized protein n=1 Tax=Necator americanus TaxID=51031 RepID=A0ABR1EXG0_NECAM
MCDKDHNNKRKNNRFLEVESDGESTQAGDQWVKRKQERRRNEEWTQERENSFEDEPMRDAYAYESIGAGREMNDEQAAPDTREAERRGGGRFPDAWERTNCLGAAGLLSESNVSFLTSSRLFRAVWNRFVALRVTCFSSKANNKKSRRADALFYVFFGDP